MSFHSTDVEARSRLDLITAVSIARPTDKVRNGMLSVEFGSLVRSSVVRAGF